MARHFRAYTFRIHLFFCSIYTEKTGNMVSSMTNVRASFIYKSLRVI